MFWLKRVIGYTVTRMASLFLQRN